MESEFNYNSLEVVIEPKGFDEKNFSTFLTNLHDCFTRKNVQYQVNNLVADLPILKDLSKKKSLEKHPLMLLVDHIIYHVTNKNQDIQNFNAQKILHYMFTGMTVMKNGKVPIEYNITKEDQINGLENIKDYNNYKENYLHILDCKGKGANSVFQCIKKLSEPFVNNPRLFMIVVYLRLFSIYAGEMIKSLRKLSAKKRLETLQILRDAFHDVHENIKQT